MMSRVFKALRTGSRRLLSETLPPPKSKEVLIVSQNQKQRRVNELAQSYVREFETRVVDPTKPFIGAQPKLLRTPQIMTESETNAATRLVCRSLTERIVNAQNGVLVLIAQDASYSMVCRRLLSDASDDAADTNAPSTIVMNDDWSHTFPRTTALQTPPFGDQLVIFIGTPGKYLAMCMNTDLEGFETAYNNENLVFITLGAVMMPVGSQEQNILGADPHRCIEAVSDAVQARGKVAWGHGAGTKLSLLERAFSHLPTTAQWRVRLRERAPKALDAVAMASAEDAVAFDHFAEYIKFANNLKLANPEFPICNYYDTGLLVSVVQGWTIDSGVSMLTDRDGLSMLRDASIGHTMSKMNQLCSVAPVNEQRGVYNFYIGDGAARLNGGIELAMHHIESFEANSLITVFIFNNGKWAIEDNLVGEESAEHVLNNLNFYNLIGRHPNVSICESAPAIGNKLAALSAKQLRYAEGVEPPGLNVVIIRGLEVSVPTLFGDMSTIMKSPEMGFLRETLGAFAEGVESRVPIYGCSAFEYIQFLHSFLNQTYQGQFYQYVCGRTDIQAAHMCGYEQPEGRCVLFINDIYGINSLGEALRMVQSGLGGKQLIVYIWHPSINNLIDNFHLHRPPMVWPSPGTELAKYYVRKTSDAVFVDFDGEHVQEAADSVKYAIANKTPLIIVNMLPECERSFIALDIRARA